MVKADPRRNYYDDLELKPSADAHEVKRQYRQLALKYHPDRNPGHEAEFIAKFQEIQSAHDVLSDPQQRAKYDADRARAGLLHTYTVPKPNVPPRSPNTNFPPPPRRAPPPTTRSNYPPPPPSAGASRYANFARETGSSRATSAAEDTKAKTDDFKAWEQMRHGQGSVPLGKSVPQRYPGKSSTFSPGREASSSMPKGFMPKNPAWSQFEDPHPGIARSKTTRVPKKTGFAPGTPGGDEPQARTASSYFNVSRGERPTPSKSNTHFPPPPPRPGTTPKRPDPLYSSKSHAGLENPFAKSGRISTPYATAGGEKTYFSSQGLGASASWRHSEFYDSEPNNADGAYRPASSATSDRNRSASPKMTSPRQPRPASSSSSSSSSSDSSSDESVQVKVEDDFCRSSRQSNGTPRPRAFDAKDGYQRSSSKPPRRPDDVKDRIPVSSSSRKQQDEGHYVRNTNGEGFMQHRMGREAAKNRPQSPPTTPSRKTLSPTNQTPLQRPLQRPRSWHHNNGSTDSTKDARKKQNGENPMYDSPKNTPSPNSSSNKWSDQWPFMSPKKPRMSTAAPPPYWAIPSSLAPRKQAEAHRSPTVYYSLPKHGPRTELKFANEALLDSFTFPKGDSQNFTKHVPPMRSHSSESINMNFSPSEWSGKFTSSTNEYFAPPLPSRGGASHGRTSPIKFQPLHSKQASSQQVQTEAIHTQNSADASVSPAKSHGSPTLPAESDYAGEEWAKHFKPDTFPYPPPPSRSPARGASRKRPKTPIRFPKTAYKRPAILKSPGVSAFVDDAGDELDTSSVTESLSSRTSGGESAMEIDQNLTPPVVGQSQTNGPGQSPAQSDQAQTTPRPSAATPISPRSNAGEPASDSCLNLNDLKKVEPLGPSQDGLKNLNELNTTLPFDSRPSNHVGVQPTPRALVLPNPPKAPQVPEKLTPPAQERYMAQMAAYMFEWNIFNTKMLSHFNERQSSVEAKLKPGWMIARGNSFEEYFQGVMEDFRVREHWELSWEKHRDCMKRLGDLRAKLLGT